MTARKGTDAMLLVDEYNFSGQTSSFEVTTGISEADATDLESDAMEYEAILPSMKISQSGYLNGSAADSFEAELNARLGTGVAYIGCLIGKADANCPAYIIDGTFASSLTIQSPAAGLITLNGDWGLARGGSRGIRIFTGELTATGAQTAVDLGSAGSDGGECYLFVQAIDGTATNADIDVESATLEAGAYSSEGTFTFSAVGSYKMTMSGTVNRWVRVNLTDLGGATGITFVMIVCTNGVTQ